jgi:hypothetical protein
VAPPPPGPEPPKKSLTELLLAEGTLTEAQLQHALEKQKKTGAFIGEVLIEEGVLDEKSLLSFLARHCRVPHLSLLDYLIEKPVLELIPKEVCLKHRLLPIDILGRNLTVAMVNPLDADAVQQVQRCCPNLRIKAILCSFKHFDLVTQRLFQGKGGREPMELSVTSLGLRIGPHAAASVAPCPEPAAEAAAKPPIEPPAAAPEIPIAPLPQIPPAPESLEAPAMEEEIPDAIEVFPGFEAGFDAAYAIPVPAHVRLDSPEGNSVFEGVFRENAERATAGAEGLVNQIAAVMMDSMRDTYSMLARRMALFRGLDPENVARIFARGATRECAEGAVVFEQGQEANEMFVILGGQVRILDGDHEIALLDRGDMFGEMALVSRQPRSATAVAVAESSLFALSLEDLRKDLPPNVAMQLLLNIIITLSARLRRANVR